MLHCWNSYQLSEYWLSVLSTLRFQLSVKEVSSISSRKGNPHNVLTEY